MNRTRMLPALPLAAPLPAAPLVAATSGNAPSTAAPALDRLISPGFTITLKTAAGKAVKTLTHGKYTIAVQDKASIHNFHLFGPGVNKATSVSATGNQTWTVTFKPGKYTYQCDPHAAVGLKATFK